MTHKCALIGLGSEFGTVQCHLPGWRVPLGTIQTFYLHLFICILQICNYLCEQPGGLWQAPRLAQPLSRRNPRVRRVAERACVLVPLQGSAIGRTGGLEQFYGSLGRH